VRWSFRIFKLAGIDVEMHVGFPVMVAWFALSQANSRDALLTVVELLLMFACVLLHELGHALAARRYGIATRKIALLPFGGVAQLERMPEKPGQELVVALAGPGVNVIIATGLWAFLLVRGVTFEQALARAELGLPEFLLFGNLLMLVFNLVPAFPMDGGRVLRAGLAMKMNYAKATRVAATIGQAFAVVFGLIGLFTNPFLILIAGFIWFGAAVESQAAQTQARLAGVPVERAMMTSFDILSPINSLRYAAQLMLAGSQQEYPVLEGGRVIGLVTRADLFNTLAQHGPLGFVARAMRRDFAAVDADDPLTAAATKLQTGQVRSMVVLRDGQLAGLLTLDNIQEFVMMQAALAKNVGSDQSEALRPT
jgi:Zn-dependent protease/CBS domain-containing protein